MQELQIIITEDGSQTIFNPHFKEIYHSRKGALQESIHVFIEAGLKHLQETSVKELNILEVGFGTGLNALLTWYYQEEVVVNYTGIEAYPLSKSVWQSLDYANLLEKNRRLEAQDFFERMHLSNVAVRQKLTEYFYLHKLHQPFEEFKPEISYDLVYYDAFAPNAQAEMWQTSCFEYLHKCLKTGGFLVTYCAKGQVKRNLRAVGFEVESLPGPLGKREMIRAKAS